MGSAGGVEVRAATGADAARLHRALVDFARERGQEGRIASTPDDILRHGFGERPAFSSLIAEEGREFAGMCLFFDSFSTWRGVPGIYVQDIWVEPGFRGRGVGELLLARAAAITAAAGGRYLRLSVDAGNAGAIAFYERLGIAWSRDERIHSLTGEAFLRLAGEG